MEAVLTVNTEQGIEKPAPGDIYIEEEMPYADFERNYIAVRVLERRVYTDAEVAQLPVVDVGHVHAAEWQARANSTQRLVAYLTGLHRPLSILEIGCGNGWLAAQLAQIPGTNVTGLDVNSIELNQAKRVFKKPNLHFVNAEFDPKDFSPLRFDIIIFAASLQYFNPVQEILVKALACLKPGGEIHITDTNFYSAGQVAAAKQRTIAYYNRLGCREMAGYYHHHQLANLEGFNYQVLKNPNSLLNRLFKKEPFYWVCIKHAA